jgi:hypothetical protein
MQCREHRVGVVPVSCSGSIELFAIVATVLTGGTASSAEEGPRPAQDLQDPVKRGSDAVGAWTCAGGSEASSRAERRGLLGATEELLARAAGAPRLVPTELNPGLLFEQDQRRGTRPLLTRVWAPSPGPGLTLGRGRTT